MLQASRPVGYGAPPLRRKNGYLSLVSAPGNTTVESLAAVLLHGLVSTKYQSDHAYQSIPRAERVCLDLYTVTQRHRFNDRQLTISEIPRRKQYTHALYNTPRARLRLFPRVPLVAYLLRWQRPTGSMPWCNEARRKPGCCFCGGTITMSVLSRAFRLRLRRTFFFFPGRCGDLVLTLRDGSKLEIRSLPDFERNYNYIRDRTSAR